MDVKEFWGIPWQIPEKGYCWVCDGYKSIDGNSKVANPPYLVQADCDDSYKARSFSDYPSTLFQDFADLSNSKTFESDVLKFAKKYGWLGEYEEINTSSKQDIKGEPVSIWINEAWRMKHMNDMWISLVKGDGFYGQNIIWMDSNTPIFAIGVHFGWDKKKQLINEGFDKSINPQARWVEELPRGVWPYSDLKGPAKYIIAKTINERLNPETGNRFRSRVRPIVRLDKSNEYHRAFMPSNLLALLWIQLYEAVTGSKKFRFCDICNELLDVTNNTKSKRVHDKCSGRERQKRYQAKINMEKTT